MDFVLTLFLVIHGGAMTSTTVHGLSKDACHDHGAAMVVANNQRVRHSWSSYVCTPSGKAIMFVHGASAGTVKPYPWYNQGEFSSMQSCELAGKVIADGRFVCLAK